MGMLGRLEGWSSEARSNNREWSGWALNTHPNQERGAGVRSADPEMCSLSCVPELAPQAWHVYWRVCHINHLLNIALFPMIIICLLMSYLKQNNKKKKCAGIPSCLETPWPFQMDIVWIIYEKKLCNSILWYYPTTVMIIPKELGAYVEHSESAWAR